MPQGYICIFAKSDEPNVSRLEYATDWKAKLKDINSNFYYDVYSCYAVIEVTSEEDYETLLHDVLEEINPNLRKQANKSFYNISPEDTYKALSGIIRLSFRGDSLEKITAVDTKPEVKKPEKTVSINQTESSHKEKNESELENIAISLLEEDGKKKGYKLSNDIVTYVRKSKNYDNYWVNPTDEYFESDWSLILHDESRKALFLFNIPAFALDPDLFEKREHEGRPDSYYIYIDCNDSNFTDVNEYGDAFKFKKFLVAIYQYTDKEFSRNGEKPNPVESKPTTTPIKEVYKPEPVVSPRTEPRPVVHPQPKTIDAFKNSIVFYTLSEIINATYTVPTIVNLNNIDYEVDNYIDVLEYIVDYLAKISHDAIYSLASSNCKEYKGQAYLSLDPDALMSSHKVRKTDLYIEENLKPNEVLDFARWLCGKAGVPTSKIYYKAYKISF